MSSSSNVTPKKSKRTVEPEAPVKKPRVVIADPGPEYTQVDLTDVPDEIDLTGESDDETVSRRSEEYKELMTQVEYQCSEISGDDSLVLVHECLDCHKLKVPVCDLCTCGYTECCTGEAKCDCEACQ